MLAAAAVVIVIVGLVVVLSRGHTPPRVSLPLRPAGELALPGDSSRFDYASLDTAGGLLFIAHLDASEVVEVDVHASRVVRVIPGLSQVHGVLMVPDRHRVYATATGVNQVVNLDKDTGQQLGRAPTGDYPDGLAYDPVHATVWTTNETGGSETVVDAASGQPKGSVDLGGEAGNVAYDSTSAHMLVDVQSRNQLTVIDPATLMVTRRVPLAGCDHDHGLAVDPTHRLAFVACDGNAALLTVDLDSWQVRSTDRVGDEPDVLAFDASTGRLYVATESGWLTMLAEHERRLTVVGRNHLADGSHVVAVDTATHRSYYPVPHTRQPPCAAVLQPEVRRSVSHGRRPRSDGVPGRAATPNRPTVRARRNALDAMSRYWPPSHRSGSPLPDQEMKRSHAVGVLHDGVAQP